MDDNKPASRFAMIAMEMDEEPELPQVPHLVVDGDKASCSACKLSGLELVSDDRVVCRACPPPGQTYAVPAGTNLATRRYWCRECGAEALITHTISEIVLQCKACSTLRAFSLQAAAVSPSSFYGIDRGVRLREPKIFFGDDKAVRSKSRRTWNMPPPYRGADDDGFNRYITDVTPWVKAAELDLKLADAVDRIATLNLNGFVNTSLGQPYPAPPILREQADEVATASESTILGSSVNDDDPRFTELCDKMRRRLNLADFDEFARIASLRGTYPRQSGRTQKCLIEAVARCVMERKRNLLVITAARLYSQSVCRDASDMIRKLRLSSSIGEVEFSHPIRIVPGNSDILTSPMKWLSNDDIVYIDHSFYDDRR